MDKEAIVNGHHETQPTATTALPAAKLNEIKVTDYIKESLDKVAFAEGFKNYDLIFDHGAQVGDGFVGQIIKIKIQEKGQEKFLNVLAKIPPGSQVRRAQMGAMGLFEREVRVYTEYLPELKKFQEEKRIDESNGFFNYPKIYFAEFNKEKDDAIIIMEDLRETEHRMWPKTKPLNYEHSKLLLVALGRFHALSFALREQKPELFDKFKAFNDFLTAKETDKTLFDFLVTNVTKSLECLDKDDVKRRTKIVKLSENLYETIKCALSHENSDPFSVITHGDCWFNNYLYHYKRKDIPDSIVLIDFQVARYVSPVIDLVYFLFLSTDHHLRAKHYDEFLSIYHNSLKEMLERLGSNVQTLYPFTALLRQLKKFGRVGVIFATMAIPMFLTKSEDILDMDYAADQINNPEKMAEIMKHFEEVMKKSADVINDRIRGVIYDAVKYGYL